MFLLEVCEAFRKNKLDYAVVGGYAVALHGAVRPTIDIDIIINIDRKSFKKAEKIMKSLKLTSRIPIKANELFKNRLYYITNKNLIAWSFVDVNNPSRVVDIIIIEDLREYNVEEMRLSSHLIRVLSKSDLIRLKARGMRRQDRDDLKALKKLN